MVISRGRSHSPFQLQTTMLSSLLLLLIRSFVNSSLIPFCSACLYFTFPGTKTSQQQGNVDSSRSNTSKDKTTHSSPSPDQWWASSLCKSNSRDTAGSSVPSHVGHCHSHRLPQPAVIWVLCFPKSTQLLISWSKIQLGDVVLHQQITFLCCSL